MKKKRRDTKMTFYDRDTYAACVRAAMTTGLPMEKISEYVKLLYKTARIKKGSGSYKKFLETIKNDAVIENLCAEILEQPDSEDFFKFTLAFVSNKKKVEEMSRNDKKPNQTASEAILKQSEKDLDESLSDLLGEKIRDTDILPSSNKVLELTNCKLETCKLEDFQEMQYIESPDKPFETIKKDFEHAEHLEEVCKITENQEVPKRLLIICSNKYTGMLACVYLRARIDTSNYGSFFEEESEFSFEDKVPVIPVHQIAPLFPNSIGIEYSLGLNYQYHQNQHETQPWWMQPELNDLPIIVLIDKDSALPSNFTEKMKLLDGHSYIFIVYERPELFNGEDVEFSFGSNNERILNNLCFTQNYQTIIIPEPPIDGEYMQKVLMSAAAEQGYLISDDVNKPELLKRLRNFCGENFEGNSSVVYLIKNAVSRKKGCSRILTNEDFSFLDRNLFIHTKRKKRLEGAVKKSAVEKLKTEIYGLEEQKQKILQAINLLKIRKARIKAGLKSPDVSPVFLFYGPPGTCKSRFAEIMGELMCEEGLLPGTRMISGNAATLCKGAYIGHTTPKTKALFENHDIIFLDEIYSVSAEGPSGIDVFSQELLAELCIQLEKIAKNCDKLVIMAGYAGDISEEHNMVQKWLNANPGIASRITFYIEFNAYSPEIEMPEIFYTLAKNADIDLEDGWRNIVIPFFKERALSDDFGNGREARRLLNNCLLIQASRIDPGNTDTAALRLITCEDIRRAAQEILKSCSGIKSPEKGKIGFL
ncbi:MAG: hypothetical protein PWQ82_1711 [Thermosediminibacterales bacterium]|nr:hypothetical protein [Thermosediminibacterales bacterium]